MKKVVNGQVYDTDMAASVVRWEESSCVAGVKVKVGVTLNRKYVLKESVVPDDALKTRSWGVSVDSEKIDPAKGEFFLSYESGVWSEESRKIVPVSDEQAKDIVEKRCSFDEYVSLFGDPRGVAVTPDAVKRAVEKQRLSDYDEKSKIVKERDAANARIQELEARIRELETL